MSVSSPAYVLHRRPYQNTGLIVHLLTREHGRVDAVAQGAQRVSKGKRRFALEFFQELNVECRGQNELLSLRSSESTSHPILFTGKALFCALYVNELLTHCLPRHEEVQTIYSLYQRTLNDLHAHAQNTACMEWVLRRFELCLLDELGYGIQFAQAGTGDVLAEDQCYTYQIDVGFMPALNTHLALNGGDLNNMVRMMGESDVTLASHPNFDAVRVTAKQLLRPIISSLLGGKPLKSRELFI